MKYYLAIDIGASSGRHMLSWIEDGKMRLQEVYRFYNGMDQVDGHLCWDVGRLFAEIVAGMKECKKIGKIPTSMGIDTWAVDYVLLDDKDQVLGNTYAYRDSRTDGMDALVYEKIPQEDLYATGGRTAWKSQDFPYDPGLFPLPAHRCKEAGIYQCIHDSTGQCQDQ